MIIATWSKIPLATQKREPDPKKRIGRGLDIGRLRHSQPETDLVALKKETTRRQGRLWKMGLRAGNAPANRKRCSLSSYSAEMAEIAWTDTKSDVSVAVSQARDRFATHFATDQPLVFAQNVYSQPGKEGGGGYAVPEEGQRCRSVKPRGILLTKAVSSGARRYRAAIKNPLLA
jgi:hypothetical protein